jgi:catalase
MSGELQVGNGHLGRRQSGQDATVAGIDFRAQFELNDTNVYMTTDTGTPIDEAVSLKAGVRGPTLLEDFIFRQKIQRFDHERV